MLMDILIFLKSSFKIFWPVGETRATISLMVKAWRWAWKIPHDCISYWKQHSVFFSHLIVIWNTVGNLNAAQLLWKLFSFSIALPAERSHTGKGPTAFTFVSCSHETSWRSELCVSNCVSVYFNKKLKYNWFIKPNSVIY